MATKKSAITKEKIVSMYMNYSLEHNEKPKSVYKFTKVNEITETEFYTFFGTIESVEKEIFKMFYDKTIELLQKDKEYESYDMRSKLLGFNFTFFELLTANRSYVVMTLKEHGNQLKNLIQLTSLRMNYKRFVSEIITDDFRTQQEQFQNCWLLLRLDAETKAIDGKSVVIFGDLFAAECIVHKAHDIAYFLVRINEWHAIPLFDNHIA